jgi:DNA-binding NarL/FixJ family response regulator
MDKQVLIVEDSAPMRYVLRKIIDASPGLHVCGEACDGVDGVEKGGDLRPDIIVLDLAMPRMNGLDAARALHKAIPNTPIILFTLHQDVLSSRQISDAGLASVVSKQDNIATLVSEIQRVCAYS